MTTSVLSVPLPRLRGDLSIRQVGEDGRCVIKDVGSGAYFAVGEEEAFLLRRLAEETDPDALRTGHRDRFGVEIDEDELADFLDGARANGLVVDDDHPGDEADGSPRARGARPPTGRGPARHSDAVRPRGSLLYWRVRLCDPSRAFEHLGPRLGFIWTRGFVAATAALILAAALTAWGGRAEYVRPLAGGWGWRTLALAWLALAISTACHECAHGLTCKRFGGEVRDMGFLLMLFMPCFYCNVSDAWLFPERWKRLWVSLAGGWSDLVLWSLGVLGWRATLPGTLVNEFAWAMASVSGVRALLNANPLIPLDGYYVLSDLVGIPNLRPRALGLFKGHLRRGLWGADRPEPEPRAGFLLGYGLASWLFSLLFVALTVGGLSTLLGVGSTWAGAGWGLLLGSVGAAGVFRDMAKGEVRRMVRHRRGRTTAWIFGLGSLAWILATFPLQDRAAGPFVIRTSARAEIRAPVAGFLRAVAADEGGWISAGERVARLEVPDLETRLAQKQAERRESEARLRLLAAGPRAEELDKQRLTATRARDLGERARRDLARCREALREQLAEIDAQLRQCRAEVDRAAESRRRDHTLLVRGALQADRYSESEKAWKVARAQLDQAEARRRAREADGCREAEAELARREAEADEAAAALRLLEAGSRPEELDAETARRDRLSEEIAYLEAVRIRLAVASPISGVLSTPWLKERVGQYFREGDLIAEVNAPARVEAEIAVSEDDITRVKPGQTVLLRFRALPHRTFKSRVARVAPVAARSGEDPPLARALPGATHNFVVGCALENAGRTIKGGMSGHARVQLGQTSLGGFLLARALRLLRTEFWW